MPEKRLVTPQDIGLATTKGINNPTVRTTSSATPVMAGYGVATTPVTFTPRKTGIIEVHCTYQVSNSTNNDGVQIQMAWGIGTAPSTGTAATGTPIGSQFKMISSSVNAYETGSVTDIITNATVNTQIWLDIQFAVITGGTASLGPATWIIRELIS